MLNCVICTCLYSQLAEEDVAVASAQSVNMAQIAVAATAMLSVHGDGWGQLGGYVISAPLGFLDARRSGEVGDVGRA